MLTVDLGFAALTWTAHLCEDMPLSLFVRVGVALTRNTGDPWSAPAPGRAASPRPHLALCAHTSHRRGKRYSALRDIGSSARRRARRVLNLRVPREDDVVAMCFSAQYGSRFKSCVRALYADVVSPIEVSQGTTSSSRCAARGSASRSELSRLTDLGAFPVVLFHGPFSLRPRGR